MIGVTSLQVSSKFTSWTQAARFSIAMPRKRKIESLQRLSLMNIADNIDKMWLRKVDEEFHENPGRFVHVIGPFSHLTGDQTQELINLLAGKKYLRKSHIHMLLTHRLKTLDLSCCSSVANRDGTLRLVPVRCQNITSLNVSGCGWASASALAEMLRGLTQLRRLELSHTKTTDQVVAVIAARCTQLSILNLFACPVTDSGAFTLCGNSSDGSTGCLSLVNLDVVATRICIKGAAALIQNLPRLQYLHFADSIEAVGQLHRDGFVKGLSLPETEKLQMKTLSASAIKVGRTSPVSFQIATTYCPYVTEILLYQDVTNETLQHLSGLKHLQCLEITCDHPGDITFEDGLSPLLSELGPKLTSLGVFDVADLNLAAVGLLCPNLVKFKCVMTLFNSLGFEVEPALLTEREWDSIFCNLRDLMVVNGVEATSSISKAFSHLMMNASSLEQLHLVNFQCLKDKTLNDALFHHGFHALKKMHLESCDFVTEHSIGQLVRADNPLSHLILKGCRNISTVDFHLLCDYVQTNNVALTIEWE